MTGPPENPLRLGAAIQMALLFQIVLWVLQALRDRLGGGMLQVLPSSA